MSDNQGKDFLETQEEDELYDEQAFPLKSDPSAYNTSVTGNYPSFDAMMTAQGGCGRFQLITYLFIIAGINSGGWMQYNLSYFLLYPEFDCDLYTNGQWVSIPHDSDLYTEKCNTDYFCDNKDVRWFIVENAEVTLDNWMNQWHL